MNLFLLRKFTAVSFCKISLKVLLLRLLLGSLLFAVGCNTWLYFIACNLTTDQLMLCQQLCNRPIGYSVSGLTEGLFTTKESAVHLFSLVSIVIIMWWFAIALDEKRTRQILREKTDCKQSKKRKPVLQNHRSHIQIWCGIIALKWECLEKMCSHLGNKMGVYFYPTSLYY